MRDETWSTKSPDRHLLAGKGITCTGRKPSTRAAHRCIRRGRAACADTFLIIAARDR